MFITSLVVLHCLIVADVRQSPSTQSSRLEKTTNKGQFRLFKNLGQEFEIAGKADFGAYPAGKNFLSLAISNPSGTGLNSLEVER